MRDLTVIGIDIAKNVMQLHGTDNKGKVLLKKRISRERFLTYMSNLPRCLVGMEACGGAHYWAKELEKLGFSVKLMSPVRVKKYAGHQKNDAKDAAACSEAVTRADMRFVPIKTEVQLEIQALHRVRSYYLKQHTGLMNMTRGLLLELGIAISRGKAALEKKIQQLVFVEENLISYKTKELLQNLLEQMNNLQHQIDGYTNQVEKLAEEDEYCKQIQTITGIGPITATALIAKIGNGSEFKKGRELSAYLGLVPKQCSSGEKQILLGISKHGDRYLRQLLIHGGRASLKAALRKNKNTNFYIKQDKHSEWIRNLAAKVGRNKASVAIANKNARMVIAVLKHQTTFQPDLAH